MKKIFLSVLIISNLISCDNREIKREVIQQADTILRKPEGNQEQKESGSRNKIDLAYIGMPISELKRVYKDAEFIEEPVYKYGIDDELNGLVVKKGDKRLLFVWTLEGDNKIHGITILSKSIVIDDNVHVGMTLESFLDKYPKAKVQIDMISDSYEYVDVPGLWYLPEFLTSDSTRVARYDYDLSEPKFVGVKRPDAKIERIYMN